MVVVKPLHVSKKYIFNLPLQTPNLFGKVQRNGKHQYNIVMHIEVLFIKILICFC